MSGSTQQPADAFARFWADMMSRMTSAAASAFTGMGPTGPSAAPGTGASGMPGMGSSAVPGMGPSAMPGMGAAAGAMPGIGASPATPPFSDEFLKQMRQSFFDAWARSCDEFMRSDQFLDMMKRSMDHALAFRKQMNEFLTRTLGDGQMPSRQDTDAIMDVLRSFQERVLDQLHSLSQRVEALERRADHPPAAATTRGGEARRGKK